MGKWGQDRNKDGRIGFGEKIRDMFDGGGAGRHGSRFEGGGAISRIGNAMGGPKSLGFREDGGWGYKGLRDMMDGGGPGQSGPRFQGAGIYSAIGNMMGGPAAFGGGAAPAAAPAAPPPRLSGGNTPVPGMSIAPGMNSEIDRIFSMMQRPQQRLSFPGQQPQPNLRTLSAGRLTFG